MPLKEKEKETIIRIAEEYGVKRMWLFGSALTDNEYNDIDLAVEGVLPEKFFNFYGRLGLAIEKEIDLIDMDVKPPIAVIVRKKGQIIYGG